MFANGLMPVFGLKLEIGIAFTPGTPGTWTYAELGAGIENLTEALNETNQQYHFMTDEGFARNHVTGLAPVYTLTGKRVKGDAAQDYIFSRKFSLNGDRASSVRMTVKDPNGLETVTTCDCTLGNIQEWSGAAADDTAISFEIRLDGKPSTPALGALTVTSVAGSASGNTVVSAAGAGIAANGTPGSGLTMHYSAGNNAAPAMTYGAALPNGVTWTEASASPILLASQTGGKYVTVALVNADSKVVAAGSAVEVVGA